MALRPPDDFAPAAPERDPPSEAELRALWKRHEDARAERERAACWRRSQELLRRGPDGELSRAHGAAGGGEVEACGPRSRAALRPTPAEGRVIAAGIDTWSPCWYAPPGSPPARALDALATEVSGRARLLPEPVAGHRLGWFPDPRLVFAEGRAGRTLARVYDKGAQRGAAPGRRLRFEAQWRFPRERRPAPASLGPAELRELFARRFGPLWQAAGGVRIAPAAALAERIGAAVADGRLAPSRARTLAGYLLLGGAGVPQGARRTTYELERECRELGLLASLSADADRSVDVAIVLDECMAPELWR